MDNVIQFPSKSVRDTKSAKKGIKEILDQGHLDERAKEELTERLFAVWESCQYNMSLSFNLPTPALATEEEVKILVESIEEAFRSVQNSFKEHLDVLVLERIKLEMKLYQLESRG